MSERTHGLALLTLMSAGIVVASCAPARAPAPAGEPQVAQAPQPAAPNRTLVMIARGEPPSLAVKTLQAAGGIGNIVPVFNTTLDFADENGVVHPSLQERLPEANTDTWRVFPDGRMETIHRLRPNLSWHDGRALTAEDFAFAWRVYATPALGVSGTIPISQMEEVSASDDRSVVIRWRRPYPDAAALKEDFQALPRHILEASFQQGDTDSFANHPFWTHQYVGLGPYRLDGWDPGAAIEAVAFEGFVLGRPRIDRIRIIFMADTNTAVAALLSGDAHLAIDFVLMYEQGAILEREWAARGGREGGAVVLSPILYRASHVQIRPEMAATPAHMDVRYRRALMHGLDRAAINDALIGGKALLADGLISPLADYYAEISRVLTRYPYDTRRARQLLDEAGLRPGDDGFLAGPDGRAFKLDVRVIANPTQEAENAIMVEGYRRLGLNAVSEVFPIALLRDGQAQSTFAGLFTSGASGGERDLGRYSSGQIAKPENRWQGTNRGAWSNPEYDRLWDAFNTTLDRAERIRQIVQMERIFSEDVPSLPHYYTPIVAAHVAALKGPVARKSRDSVEVVQIHKWEWQY